MKYAQRIWRNFLPQGTHLFVVVVILAAPSIFGVAQDLQVEVQGHVVDESNADVPFANIALYNLSDSSLVTRAVSDEKGRFSFKSAPGKYFVKVSFLSYEDKVISNISINSEPLELGTIRLITSQSVLDEIVVEGERSTMELQLDKRIFNVGKDLINISGSAADILDNVPSVNVDVEGNVSLRGSQNVRILIDGKPSGLTGISTADALRQVQANLIESVEVITNPSARYDAEGEVGIINIILKKEFRRGINGAFTLNAGYPDNYGGSYNLNFRGNKFNFFSSYGISYREGPGSGSSYQQFNLPDTTFAYEQNNRRIRGGLSHNIIGGLDYYFSEKSILTGSFVYRRSDGLNTAQVEFRDLDASNALIRTVVREEREEEPEDNSEIGLSYKKEFMKEGKTFTADFKWIENVETEISQFTETDDSDNSITNQRAYNTENERNLFIQADFIAPFKKEGKFESGLRSTLRVIDNDFLVEEQNDESEWNALPAFDNNMIYTENIYAGYVMLSNQVGKFSYQAGLRGELTDISVELKNSEDINYQTYFNLFPSTHVSYKINEQKTLQLSYSYRLSRPGFRDLLPFSNFTNNRSLSTGNPDLRPEYTHSIEGGYLLNWKSGSILTSAYYRRRLGVIEEITIVDSVGYDRRFPINLSAEDAYGLEFNLSWNPADWFRYTANANFYRAVTNGEYDNQVFFRDTYTWTGRSIARITFLKKWDFQTSLNYMAPQITPQGRSLSVYSIDLALARDLMKGNGTITLSVRDLLNTRRWRNEIISDEFYSKSDFQWRARQFLLSFTYRLNQKRDATKSNEDRDFNDGDF
jgi:outer membrane receptor protein involved in Fe transport